ncbi:MAG: choice-of-anchor J domain-containing protein [Bacteroidales bacterium]|nr:choice-of-anchor J domain-containing protein [Bacteroidales bacterium]MDD4384914.1 choice-of-anchor J domain-containing protein [Bacteroidales bacterium]
MKKTLLVITGLFLGFSLLAQNVAREVEASTSINTKTSTPKGVIYSEGFEVSTSPETGLLPEGWVQKRTTTLDATPETDASAPKWFRCEDGVYGFEDSSPYIRTGVASMATGYTAPNFTWAISPEIAIPTPEEGATTFEYWTWYKPESYATSYYVKILADDTWTTVITMIGTEATNNLFTTAVTVDLTPYHGKTIQIAFIYEYTDGMQMAIDDITIYNSDAVGISTNQFDNLKAYPNPFTNEIKVNSNVERVVVYNLIGQEVMNVKMTNNTINTSDLSSGVYVVAFQGANGERAIRKMIKR